MTHPIVPRVNAWFAKAARPLAWRSPETTPWGVLVSEFMSQQTQVSRVEPKWREFMQRWPTPAHLAAATDADVLRAWDRLGYPRRALWLRRTAIEITERFGGEVPGAMDALLALPGIGPYTAAAVCSFAFGMAEPVVDTNVRRVLARAAHGEALPWQPNANRDARELRLVAPVETKAQTANALAFNAAAMELGALVCTARSPKCAECPISSMCAWRLAGYPEPREAPARKQPAFKGSDRELRGAILRALRLAHGPLPVDDVYARVAEHLPGTARPRFDFVVAGLESDSLIELIDHDVVSLPGG